MDFERLCDNHTAFTVRAFGLDDRDGRELAVAVAKITWKVSDAGEARLAVPQRPVRPNDVALTEETFSSLRYPTDRVEAKPGTDVIMNGHAHPPADREVTSSEVSLRVAANTPLSKTVRVYGTRMFVQGAVGIVPGPPAPLTVTPLVYEYARGGADLEGDKPKIEWRNPAGVGVTRDPKSLIGSRAFQLESVTGTEPAGFGALVSHWEPRLKLAGTYDENWMRKRAPIKPRDFDPRHNCAAHPDLRSEAPLKGDEAVEVLGATASQVWRFKLPNYAPRFESTQGGETTKHESHLDTFLIDSDAGLVELTWRCAVLLPRKSEHLEKISVYEAVPLSEDMYDKLHDDLKRYETTSMLQEGA